MTRKLPPTCLPGWLVLIVAAGAHGQVDPANGPSTYDCGVAALYTLLRLEGRTMDLRAIASRLPLPSPRGHSMKDLRDASGACGLRLDGVRLDKHTDAIDRPMLVFLKRGSHGHFVTIRPVGHTGSLVQVIDSARGSEVMDSLDLMKSQDWTGLALIPAGPGWAFDLSMGLASVAGLSITFGLVRRFRARRAGRTPESAAVRALP